MALEGRRGDSPIIAQKLVEIERVLAILVSKMRLLLFSVIGLFLFLYELPFGRLRSPAAVPQESNQTSVVERIGNTNVID